MDTILTGSICCLSVTENAKMLIINSVIHISLFVYTLLARGANLKIQAVLNKRWQIPSHNSSFSQNKSVFSDARKTRNKYTRFSHSPISSVYCVYVREGRVTTKLSLKNLAPIPSGGCKARCFTGKQKKVSLCYRNSF